MPPLNEVKEKKLTEAEKQELEKAVDESIKELEEIPRETIKDFEEMEKTVMSVSNEDLRELINDVKSLAISNKSFMVDMKKDELKIDNAILRKIEKSICLGNEINTKFNKTMGILFILFFAIGLIIGTQVDLWSPYIKEIIDFLRFSNQLKV